MNNFIFKSHGLIKNSSVTLDNLNKNILYVTHQVDSILKTIRSLQTDIANMKTTDDYYRKSLEDYDENQPELEDK